jgi:thiosulfate/3-mercaptopyruvate sulfurtransferase
MWGGALPAQQESSGELPFVISTETLATELDSPDLVLLHVSEGTQEYQTAHIPGALLLEWERFVDTDQAVPNEFPSLDELTQTVRSLGIEEKSKIVLYDAGSGVLAARAFVTLDVLGLGDRTRLLDGQLKRWKKEERPLEEGPAREVEPSSLVLKPNLEKVVKKSDVERVLEKGDDQGQPVPRLLDSRSPKEFKEAGHLPGAVNLPWDVLVEDREDPTYLPMEQLLMASESAGVKKGEPVVTYCNSGRSASLLYFIMRNLGHDVQLYDGSFSEWSLDEAAPVEKGTGEDSKTD